MSEDRIPELDQRRGELEAVVEDLIGLARGSEHAIVVLASYLAHEIDGLDTKEYLSHLRRFERWPKRALVRKGKQKARGRLPNLVRESVPRGFALERGVPESAANDSGDLASSPLALSPFPAGRTEPAW